MSKVLPKGGSALCYVQGYERPAQAGLLRFKEEQFVTNMMYRHVARGATYSLLAMSTATSTAALGQERYPSEGYAERLENFEQATEAMVIALADVTLDSACLTDANFERLTAALDEENKTAADHMREMGRRTLTQEDATSACGRQSDHAHQLRTALSSSQTWAEVRDRARLPAMLSETEEIRDGLLMDDDTGQPVNSDVVMSSGFRATIPTNLRGGRTQFIAVLTVSPNGYVASCDIERSSGNELVDRRICRHAMLPLIHRPAFVEGRPAASTIRLHINVDG